MATKVEPFYEALGQKIRGAREDARLSQAELAERLTPRLTRASIANIESAKQRVLSHMLVDIADALGVSVVDLLPARRAAPVETPRAIAPSVIAELERELGQERGEALAAKLNTIRRRAAS